MSNTSTFSTILKIPSHLQSNCIATYFQNIMVSLSSEQVQKYYEPMCIHLPLIGLAVEEMAGRGVPAVSVTIQLKIS